MTSRPRLTQLPGEVTGRIYGFLPGSSLRYVSRGLDEAERYTPQNPEYAIPSIQLRNIEKLYPGLGQGRRQAYIDLGKGNLDSLITYLRYKSLTPTQKYWIAEGAAGVGRRTLVNLLIDSTAKGASTVPINRRLYQSMLESA